MKHKIARFLKWFSVFLAFYVISGCSLDIWTEIWFPTHLEYPPASEDIIHIWETTPYEEMWKGYEHWPPGVTPSISLID